MPEVVNVKQHQAQRAVRPLHAVGLAKQHRQQSLAVIHPSQPVQLRIQRGALRSVSSSCANVRAHHHLEPKLPVSRFRRRAESGRRSRPRPAGPSIPRVTLSEIRTIGTRLPPASARIAASNCPIGIPGSVASSSAKSGACAAFIAASAACAERTTSTRAPVASRTGSTPPAMPARVRRARNVAWLLAPASGNASVLDASANIRKNLESKCRFLRLLPMPVQCQKPRCPKYRQTVSGRDLMLEADTWELIAIAFNPQNPPAAQSE